MEDSKIIELFLAGSEQAEIKLLRKYGRICREIAFCILNNREEAEECVNQACTEYELTGYIEDFLDMLDKKSRVMFVRRYWYAEPVKAIAEEFGMTENRTSEKLLRVRKKLKTYLEKRSQIKFKLRRNIRRIGLAAGVCLLMEAVVL